MKNLTINVGDYAKSYDGHIARCKRFYSYDNFIYFDKDIIDTCCEPTNYFDKKDIKKYIKVVSPNIIDLIEVGDYVNGCIVINKKNDTIQIIQLIIPFDLKEKDIKSIVTKEQFKNMEYKIEN